MSQLVLSDAVPGCAAAVAERGVVVWQGSRGLADVEAKTPIGPSSTFDIASVSKQFTATGLLMLAQAGQLSTADPLSQHVRGLPAWADRVTLLQLMHQTSGIPDYFGQGAPAGWEDSSLDRDEVLAKIATVKKLHFTPGSTWEYSNSNYFLLGVVIERVTGQSLSDFFRERMFAPLGLGMSADPASGPADQARSYRANGVEFEPVTYGFYALGAARVRSNAADLARWGDTYRSDELGGAELRDLRQQAGPETGLESSRWAAGVFVLASGRLYMNGYFDAFKSVFLVSADRQRSASVLCNRADSTPDVLSDSLAFIWGMD